MGSRRKERFEQFRRDLQFDSLATDLVCSAVETLRRSLDERHDEVVRNKKTHTSSNAPAAVILFATAFDTALTELAVWEAPQNGTSREIANLSMANKYKHHAGPEETAALRDLRLLSDLRDELVHFLPRSPRTKENVPHWFKPLHKRGLFIVTGRVADFTLAQKLASYALGYWAAEVVDRAAQALRKRPSPFGSLYADCLCSNFELYREITSPEAFAEYDERHGLALTSAR